jgi:hypothetical protein
MTRDNAIDELVEFILEHQWEVPIRCIELAMMIRSRRRRPEQDE